MELLKSHTGHGAQRPARVLLRGAPHGIHGAGRAASAPQQAGRGGVLEDDWFERARVISRPAAVWPCAGSTGHDSGRGGLVMLADCDACSRRPAATLPC